MSEHRAVVTVHAPVHQVYELFTHFNDFPKFMHFVQEVTYYDDQRSHWVVRLAGTHEWDAVNVDWIPNQQVGWRSTRGLENSGRVRFTPVGNERTQIDVSLSYNPPAGVLGAVADRWMVDAQFATALQQDLDHFARMVEEAPEGALDPMSSHYLFHSESAAARGQVTEQQKRAMEHDPMMSSDALQTRQDTIAREETQTRQRIQEQEATTQQYRSQQQEAAHAQQQALQRQAELDRQAEQERRQSEQNAMRAAMSEREHNTLGGRGAAQERTALGDQDARSERFPQYQQDPMLSRAPGKLENGENTPVSDMEIESPWRVSIHGPGTAPERQTEQEDSPPPAHDPSEAQDRAD